MSTTLTSCFSRLSLSGASNAFTAPLVYSQIRLASHASQGVANGAKQGPGKRLGAKKGDSELVVPGNIIFRQRGSHWHPGENCVMGRDHTISALAKGYVRYYRDPLRHKTRKYIGVVFNQNDRLPRRQGLPRQRRLGMEASYIDDVSSPLAVEMLQKSEMEMIKDAIQLGSGKRRLKVDPIPDVKIRGNYQVRESNWSIGRTPEREGIKVRLHSKKDRWYLFRQKRAKRKAHAATRLDRRVGRERKPGGAPKKS